MVVYDETQSNFKRTSVDKFRELKGYLTEKEARSTFIECLYSNLSFTVHLLTDGEIRLFPYQEIMLRSWFDHNFNMAVWGRGTGKSWTVALFCILYCLFYPNTRIVLASNAFRSTRRIMAQIERTINHKHAGLLKACFNMESGRVKISKRGDEWRLDVNGGYVMALPLNEKIRGTRADILIADEALMIPEEIYRDVLMPFLLARNDVTEQIRLKELETIMIQAGDLKEEDRTILQTDKKIIALTSASYDFEFICKLYHQWVDTITNKEISKLIRRKYFVSRLSYKAVPEELIAKEIVEEAKNGGEESPSFQREYMAMFSSSSGGYFNIKKLHEHTVRDGEYPVIAFKGTPESKYILAVDPSFSSSKSSDFFAMGVYLLNIEERTLTQVHTYGVAGGELKDHIKYLYYLLINFNITMLIADLGGANFNFIQTANESAFFIERNYKLQFFEGDFDQENYLEELKKAKNSYRLFDHKICYRQIFSSQWLQKSNEFLQSQIDKGKIKFASRIKPNEEAFTSLLKTDIPILFDNSEHKDKNISEAIDKQEDMIDQTKAQLALIEIKTTAQGTQQFDLPTHLRRSKSADRARKDNYTCLLMATWMAKVYYDILFTPEDKKKYGFTPTLIK